MTWYLKKVSSFALYRNTRISIKCPTLLSVRLRHIFRTSLFNAAYSAIYSPTFTYLWLHQGFRRVWSGVDHRSGVRWLWRQELEGGQLALGGVGRNKSAGGTRLSPLLQHANQKLLISFSISVILNLWVITPKTVIWHFEIRWCKFFKNKNKLLLW